MPRKRQDPAEGPTALQVAQAEFDDLSAEGASYSGDGLLLAFGGLRLAIDAELSRRALDEEAAVDLKLKAANAILSLALANNDASTATQIGPTIDTLTHLQRVVKEKPKQPKKAPAPTRTTVQSTGGAKT